MPQTLFDKIWDAHYVATRADGRDLVYIDRHVLHELHAPHAFEKLAKARRSVRRADLTFSMQDHTVSTRPGRNDETVPSGAAFLRAMREGSKKNGIRVFDLGDPEQGISHVVAPEVGTAMPSPTKTWSARTTRRPRRCTSSASNSPPRSARRCAPARRSSSAATTRITRRTR